MRLLPNPSSLRTRFLLVVLGASVIPFAMLGLWLNRSTRQSGEQLLRGRLDSALVIVASDAGLRWVHERSALLLIAEDDRVQQVLKAGSDLPVREIPLPALAGAAGEWRIQVEGALVRDATGRPRWALVLPDDATPPRLMPVTDITPLASANRGMLGVTLSITSAGSSQQIGTLEAWLRTSGLVSSGAASGAASAVGPGAVITILDRTGAPLLPIPFEAALLEHDYFRWAGQQWLTSRRMLEELPVTLLAAAPLDPFTAPFANAARTGVWALVLMTVAAFLLTLLLTRRLTRSLEQLATAADAVSRGDLEQRIGSRSGDEVGRVAQAFDGMTESLRRTLRQLSERQAVAAVGEFASTLAHEVRNPLGAMRLNLQSIEERIGNDPQMRSQMRQALGDVERLERTVAGALQVARSGRVNLERIDVRKPIELAMRSASAEFTRRGAVLAPIECSAASTLVQGDSAALERLFLNLLLNAAQALGAGQHTGMRIESRDRLLTVSVWDCGSGIPAAARERILEPFYSTKPDGTGLGLSIARQIVAAHAGELQIESEVGEGTTIRVILTLAT